jgi:uncharacterized protein with NAD-binding domain and iron-sulfur cluster
MKEVNEGIGQLSSGTAMPPEGPIKVAIIGGGCAAITAAFELTRPHHQGKYEVTVYQLGWRLGGKGASGRGPARRIEEHGLHVWLGFYENAFRLLRECYAELNRDPRSCPIATWRDAFFVDPYLGVANRSPEGDWLSWLVHFPPAEGLPGDQLTTHNPFTVSSYFAHTVALLRTLLFGLRTRHGSDATACADSFTGSVLHADGGESNPTSGDALIAKLTDLLNCGVLVTTAGLIEALAILELVLKLLPAGLETVFTRLIEFIASMRDELEKFVTAGDDARCKWEIIDVVLACLVGAARFRLLFDSRGFSVIDDYEFREWLQMNGASKRSVESAFVRGLYDLAIAHDRGVAAGQALRGSLRMFFTYRGALFWKMRAGMGDVVFAPFYEVLKKRGVRFNFFHRLENVMLADPRTLPPGERPYVTGLEFDVQARILDGKEYQPLIDVKGLPCWPSLPDYDQLEDGARLREERWRFESHWDRRKVHTTTLQVTRDFDLVVLGVSIGVVPHVCQEILTRDARWRAMVENVKTVSTQAFQLWMGEDMPQLGWTDPPATVSAFIKPFDTWSDMGHVVVFEDWKQEPRSIAYFCNVLSDPAVDPDRSQTDYPERRRREVRENAVHFLNNHVGHLWPRAIARPGRFRWDLLVDPEAPSPEISAASDERIFSSQYWTANVNPTDRYVLVLPGSLRHRISPLDNTYDNMTIAGDWTDCGFNSSCVEAAVMSGRLAAHAIAQFPPLEDIVGYDHP